VGGERDEVRLQLVRALERERLVLVREQAGSVEGDSGQGSDRPEQAQLVLAEERGVRRRPDEQRSVRDRYAQHVGVLLDRRGE
jgi:hypothetical protein